MAVTVTKPNSNVADFWGRHPVTILQVTFDNSYAAGGEAINLSAFAPGSGPSSPVFVAVSPDSVAAEGWVVHYDYANEKLIVFEQSDSDNDVPLNEVNSTTDLSGLVVRLLVVFG